MLFEKKCTVYIKRNGIDFFQGGVQELQIPSSIYQNIEILDLENFKKIVSDFAKSKLKKCTSLIILSDDLIFSKEIVAKDENDLKFKSDNFLSSIPHEEDSIRIKKIRGDEKVLVLATNKKIYETVKNILEDLDWKVNAVVPVTLFKDELGIENNNFDENSSKKIASSKDLIKISDFLSDEEEQRLERKSTFKLYIYFGVFILFLAGILLLAFRFGYLSFKVFDGREITPIVNEASESAKETEATESGQLAREEIKVQILNGSGVAGQAGKIRDQLIRLGYNFTNIEVGNAETSEYTEILFSLNMSGELKDEILESLRETFENVIAGDKVEEGDFDIKITTGTE